MDRTTDRALATRLETVVAASQRAYAEVHGQLFPEFGASWIEVGGGIAAFLEVDSPANGAFALGMREPVDAEQFDAVCAFFRTRGSRPVVCACPLADPSLARALDERGFSAASVDDVLVRELGPAERFEPPAEGIEVRIARTAEERDAWAATVAAAFAAPDAPRPAETRLGLSASRQEGSLLFSAHVGGEMAGVGELWMADGIALLTADATLPEFRRRGVQASLQRARLAAAAEAGCTLAMSEAMPGSASERNMERLGFRIVYTRVEALGPAALDERT